MKIICDCGNVVFDTILFSEAMSFDVDPSLLQLHITPEQVNADPALTIDCDSCGCKVIRVDGPVGAPPLAEVYPAT